MTAAASLGVSGRRGRAAVAPRAAVAAIGAFLVASLVLVAGPAPARAATPDLTLSTATTYDVVPASRKVAVTSKVTATNHLKDTVTKRFFFRTGYLTVLPGTSSFKVSANGLTPTVTVVSRTKAYTLIRLNFGSDLAAGRSIVLTLSFEIKDPGGAPDRPVRISPSIVSFTAWAYATPETPGSSVAIRFPGGYHVAVGRGPLSGPVTDSRGVQVWQTGKLSSPLTWIADLTADRPGDYASRSLSAKIGTQSAAVTLRSWPDDPAWRDRVADLLVRGLPALGVAIGVPWSLDGPLIVQEALVRNTGGYAGLFDPASRQVLISYTASSGVVLHEAAHAWFNGRLVADRWAAEAFASYYADVAASKLKVKITSPSLTDELRKHAFALNDWGAIGTETDEAEAYAYAASLALAREIADRAGPDAMRAVWARAVARGGAYQPPTGVEPLNEVPDWRGLLDLLEDETGRSFADLWREWVARPDDIALLDTRAAARTAYDRAVADAGDWALPRSIRDAMRTWQFDEATRLIDGAETVIAQRNALRQAATVAGVTLPPTLETLFESEAGLPAAAAEASAEISTVEAIRQAAATEPKPGPGTAEVLVSVGLIGADPSGDLDASKAALAAGRLEDAITAASEAASTWSTAAETGRTRLVSAGLLGLSFLLLARIIVLWSRRGMPKIPFPRVRVR